MLRNILKNLFIQSSLLFVVLPVAYSQDLSDSAEARINYNFDLVRDNFSGEEAYETVAFVEKYWRVAGNHGFNTSIDYVANQLEKAGYVREGSGQEDHIFTYRIEKRPMEDLTWEPLNASLELIEGDNVHKILDFSTNRNMIAINSWSTPDEGVAGELVYLDPGLSEEQLGELNLEGKIVFAENHPLRLFSKVVKEKGALGLIVYSNPDYIQPSKNTESIQFKSIPQDTVHRSWAICTSYSAKEKILGKLSEGPIRVRVKIETELYESEELTLVADVKGRKYAGERIVYSAHVQEPGANDNASGVGVQTQMATVTAGLVQSGDFIPDRTMTFLFGDEIVSTRRYINDDRDRAKGIKWGISLDMVGENTDITGGTFLIEKMPDPSAVWTRGDDKHTEWGGYPLGKEQIFPHYFNDFIIHILRKQGEKDDWIVNTNPFEGGSDHVPFLRADIPGLLLWHFTDAFYHTDGDRLDKVSSTTLKNVGIGALVAGMTLVNSDEALLDYTLRLLEREANSRLLKEAELSKSIIASGGSKEEELDILNTWTEYYEQSIRSTKTLLHPSDLNKNILGKISLYKKRISQKGDKLVRRLD